MATSKVTTTTITKEIPVNPSIQTVQPQRIEIVQNPIAVNTGTPAAFPTTTHQLVPKSGETSKTVETVKTTTFTDGTKKEERTVEQVNEGLTPIIRQSFDVSNQMELEQKLQEEKVRRGLH